MAKRGIFETLGLVERVPEEDSGGYIERRYTPGGEEETEDLTEAESVEEVKDTLVADIYQNNNITDLSSSIYKVEDVMSSLPMEMPTDTKRKSVLGILASFSLTEESVSDDGTMRMEILESVKNQIKNKNDDEISMKVTNVENLKSQIESLQREISELQESTRTSQELIDAEVNKIQSLVSFISGGGK